MIYSYMQHYIKGEISENDAENQSNITKMKGILEFVWSNMSLCRKILLPIHYASHWHLMEVNFEHKEFKDYNSLRSYRRDREMARWVSLQY